MAVEQYVEGKNPCPECRKRGEDKSGDNFHWYGEDEGGYCHSCSFTIPSKEFLGLTGKKVKGDRSLILESDLRKLEEKRLTHEQLEDFHSKTVDAIDIKYRGLDNSVCKRLGVRWTVGSDGMPKAMHFPAKIASPNGGYEITGYKSRDFPKSFYSTGYVGKCSLFLGQENAVEDNLIIVAGENDLITAISALENSDKYRKSYNVISCPIGEDMTSTFIRIHYDWVNAHKKIIVCMDNDAAGEEAFNKIQAVLDNDKLYKANLRHNDLNDYLKFKDGDKIVGDIFWNPLPVETFGISGSGDIYGEMLKAAVVESIPLPPFLYGLKKVFPSGIGLGEIFNIISSTSTGKTVVVNQLTLDWVMSTPHKMLICALEDSMGTYGLKIASKVSGVNLMRLETSEERLAVLEKYKTEIDKYLYNEDGSHRFNIMKKIPRDVGELKKAILQAIKIYDSKVILFDPLSSIVHTLTNEEQTDFMLFEEQLKTEYGVTVINVLHTRKTGGGQKGHSEGGDFSEEDTKGSGAIISTATINLLLRRNKMATCPIEKNTTYIKVTKNRTIGITGEDLARIYYSPEHHTLFEYEYAEKHDFFRGITPEQLRGIIDPSKSAYASPSVSDEDMDDGIEVLTNF